MAQPINEKLKSSLPGGAMLVVLLLLQVGCFSMFVSATSRNDGAMIAIDSLVWITSFVCFWGLFIVNPNEARVLQFFGSYIGTVRENGLRWANPFYSTRRVSLRVNSLESTHLKVNDIDGNPIEIAAIVVWKVVDTAQALFQVDNYPAYVRVQSESALRNLATRYPYDAHDDEKQSLRGHTDAIAEHLAKEITERIALAGVQVVEARISHLAYAPEIAQSMLQRQQAAAIIAARQKIVDGAVGMVEMALERLARNKVVVMDEERKAAMVSNLLVVLCGERATQPVVNTGSIYQ